MSKKKKNQIKSIAKEYKEYSKSQKSSESPFFLTSLRLRLDKVDRNLRMILILSILANIGIFSSLVSYLLYSYYHPIKLSLS